MLITKRRKTGKRASCHSPSRDHTSIFCMKLSTALPVTVHTPYEAPPTFMERFNFIADTPVGDTYPTADRQRYAAMTNFIDTAVGNVTDALRARGMWDDLLILSTR